MKTANGGEIRFTKSPLLDAEEPVDVAGIRRMGAEQSNSSINIDDRMALKIYRRLQPGANPEVEIGRFLTDVAHFNNAPPTFGVVEHRFGPTAWSPRSPCCSASCATRATRGRGPSMS